MRVYYFVGCSGAIYLSSVNTEITALVDCLRIIPEDCGLGSELYNWLSSFIKQQSGSEQGSFIL